MHQVVDAVADLAAERWGAAGHERADVVWRLRAPTWPPSPGARARRAGATRPAPRRAPARRPSVRLRGRLAEAGVTDGPADHHPQAALDAGAAAHRARVPPAEAGHAPASTWSPCARRPAAPTSSECWNDGTATFMINGERCTRACGFCLVDTSKPLPARPRRAGPGGGGGGRDGPALRGGHRRGPRRPARRRRRGVRRHHRGRPPAGPGLPGRGAHPRLQGRRATRWRASSPPGPTC